MVFVKGKEGVSYWDAEESTWSFFIKYSFINATTACAYVR